MEQKLITNFNLKAFTEEVNKHLAEGWYVVTGTLVVGITSTSVADRASVSGHTRSLTDERWAVVLQKLDKKALERLTQVVVGDWPKLQ